MPLDPFEEWWQSDSSSSEDSSDGSLIDSDGSLDPKGYGWGLRSYNTGETIIDSEGATIEPHQVAKARHSVLQLLLSTCAVLNDVQADQGGTVHFRNGRVGIYTNIDHPWSDILVSLKETVQSLDDRRVRGVKEILAGLAVFDHLAQTRLDTFIADKAYTREKISKAEAKCIPPLLSQLKSIRGHEFYPHSTTRHAILDDTSPDLISRTARSALQRPGTLHHTLDLSNLSTKDLQSILSSSFMIRLCDVFGLDRESVTQLSLARNNMTNWQLFVFCNLTTLDISFNRKLRALPLTMTTLPHLHRLVTKKTDLQVRSQSFERSLNFIPKTGPTPRHVGVRSLTDLAATIALEAFRTFDGSNEDSFYPSNESFDWTEYGLPPQIVEMLNRSYQCDVCRRTVLPNDNGYIGGLVHPPWAVKAEAGDPGEIQPDGRILKRVRLEGRACRSCLSSTPVIREDQPA